MYRHNEYYYDIPCKECNLNYFSLAYVLTVKHVIEDGSKKYKTKPSFVADTSPMDIDVLKHRT